MVKLAMGRVYKKQNLIPSTESSKWYSWCPAENLSPYFIKEKMEDKIILKIYTTVKSYCFGKWLCDINTIESGSTYYFQIEFLPSGIKSIRTDISVMLTWKDGNGKSISREYIMDISEGQDEWKSLYGTMKAPDNSKALKVELHLRSSGGGMVCWRNPLLVNENPVPERKVRVATTLITTFYNNTGENLNTILNVIDKAGSLNPDTYRNAVYNGS